MPGEHDLRRSRFSPLLWPLAPNPSVRVDAEGVHLRFGVMGRADIPHERIARSATIRWPWIAGTGVRLARRMVAFTLASGPHALLELEPPVTVRAPLSWRAHRVAIGVADVDAFLADVARYHPAVGG